MIINGALELIKKKAKDAMTLLSDTFAIDINAKLDRLVSILLYCFLCCLVGQGESINVEFSLGTRSMLSWANPT